MARLTDRPDMTLDVYRERKTTIQQQQQQKILSSQTLEFLKQVIILKPFNSEPLINRNGIALYTRVGASL